jgi:asparagine N-glycosylation enzyme membrane subunit Stt3
MAVTRKKFKMWHSIRGGLVAGSSAAILNNAYNDAYGVLLNFSMDEYINFPVITFLSIISSILASVGYFMLVKITRRYGFYFNIACVVILLISLLWSISPTLPDSTHAPKAFKMLSVGIHVITAGCIMVIIPKATDVRRY